MTARTLGPQDLERLMLGASVFGTGGGGSFSVGRDLVRDLAARGMAPTLLPVASVDPGAFGISTVILGGGLTQADLDALGMISDEPASWIGARALERFLGRPIDFVYPIELGPQNTLEAVRLAAFLGVPLLDGDCAGRAVPEMHQTTLSHAGITLTPYVVTTFQGDSLIVGRTAQEHRNETICRALAGASGGVINVAGFALTGAQARDVLLPGTLSRCMAAGEDLQAGAYPAERLAQRLGGQVRFRGRVRSLHVDTAGSFFRGALTLEGIEEHAGHTYDVGFQNEYLWSWRDGQLDVHCPDLICVLASDSGLGKVTYGNGFENAIEGGEDLTVLRLPADTAWTRGDRPCPFPPPPLRTSLPGVASC